MVEFPLLSTLPEADRRELRASGRPRRFARNEVVCHAGDPADALHLVTGGRLAVRVSLPSGETVMVNVLGPGRYFGELALLRADGHRTATVVALEDATTLAITYRAFRRLCEERPLLERSLTELLADRIDELTHRVLELTHVGLDRRISRRLLELCDGEPAPVSIALTQAQLGELTGGTRPTVNQALQRLVDRGVVALGRGRIDVLDVDRLRGRCGY